MPIEIVLEKQTEISMTCVPAGSHTPQPHARLTSLRHFALTSPIIPLPHTSHTSIYHSSQEHQPLALLTSNIYHASPYPPHSCINLCPPSKEYTVEPSLMIRPHLVGTGDRKYEEQLSPLLPPRSIPFLPSFVFLPTPLSSPLCPASGFQASASPPRSSASRSSISSTKPSL